jgi:hypothetical protein
MDEWLAKQRASTPTPVLSPAQVPAVAVPQQPQTVIQPTPLVQARQTVALPSAPDNMAGGIDIMSASPDSSQLVSALATPTPPANSSSDLGDSAGNISSAQLDQQEIDQIAEQLKKGLKPAGQDPSLATAGQVATTTAPLSVEPAPEIASDVPKPGILKARKPPEQTEAAPDDTIFIDNEGQIHARDEGTALTPEA